MSVNFTCDEDCETVIELTRIIRRVGYPNCSLKYIKAWYKEPLATIICYFLNIAVLRFYINPR